MEWLGQFFGKIVESVKWYFVLQPWEQALRVRAGKNIKLYEGGIHFKIPYLDYVFSQNTRLRPSFTPSQTLTTQDFKTITLSGALRYRVIDILPLYMSMHDAEQLLGLETLSILSKYIPVHDLSECAPAQLDKVVNENLDLEKYGLRDVEFVLLDYMVVKTYRFLTGGVERWTEDTLNTDKADE